MEKGFALATQTFFGRQPGQTLAEFGQEIKALSPEDRTELAAALSSALGVEVAAWPKEVKHG